MANNKNLKPFKSGNPGGPGRPKDPPELKALKKLTKGELELLLNRILNAKPEDINTFNSTILEKWLASIVFHGMKTGDFGRLSPFLERMIGKVKDEMNVDGGITVTIRDYTKE